MTPRERVLAQLAHRETAPVPYTLYFMGGLSAKLDAHFGGRQWRERLTWYHHNCAPLDWGRKERLPDGRFRDVFGTIKRDDGLAEHVEIPALPEPALRPGVIPTFASLYDAAKVDEMRARLAASTALRSATAINPGLFELTWMLRGFDGALADMVDEPVFYEELLERLMELALQSVDLCLTLPVDAVVFGDDWGDQNGLMMGPELWRRYFKPRYAKLYGRVKAAGKLIKHHSCGSVADIAGDLIDIGLDTLDPVQPEPRGMNPYELKRRFGQRLTLWGGLGSQTTIPFGTPQTIRDEVRRLCTELGRGGGYVLAPAKALRDETPLENALAVLDAFTNQTAP